MMRRPKAWLLVIQVALLLLGSPQTRGQFRNPYGDENGPTVEEVLPLARLLKGVNSLLYESGNAGYWDSGAGHYRGSALRSLHYPEMLRAGYRSFRVISLNTYQGGPDLRHGDAESILTQSEAAAARDKGRETKVYHFDDSGWLRAIISTHLNPSYESFSEAADSLLYDFRGDGSVGLQWTHTYFQTGSGRGSAKSGCPPPAWFLTVQKSERYDVEFDSWQQLAGYTLRTEEIWDTCRGGGPVYQKRRLIYDSLGRLLLLADSSGSYPAPASSLVLSYEDLPFERLEERVRANYQYAPLREATIRNRLLNQGPLHAVVFRRISTNNLYYQGNGTYSYRPDSPQIQQDTGLYIVNRRMELLASRAPGQRQALSVYDRGLDSATAAPVFRVQHLPVPPDPDGGSVTVCDPLALGSVFTSGLQVLALGNDTLFRFMQDDGGSGSVQKLHFSALPPATMSPQLRSMALKDRRGLLKYLWTGGDTYQLSYQP